MGHAPCPFFNFLGGFFLWWGVGGRSLVRAMHPASFLIFLSFSSWWGGGVLQAGVLYVPCTPLFFNILYFFL